MCATRSHVASPPMVARRDKQEADTSLRRARGSWGCDLQPIDPSNEFGSVIHTSADR